MKKFLLTISLLAVTAMAGAQKSKVVERSAVGVEQGVKEQAQVVRAQASKFMQMAIDEARMGIRQGHGGPFGTVIVKNGEVVGRGHNCVLRDHDATAHGEGMAIRDAGRRLGTFDLSGCVLYTTGEPCHMCLCACMWANIDKVYYGCTIEDNGLIGFRDDKFDKIFGGRDKMPGFLNPLDRDKCLELFKEYNSMPHEGY